MKKIDDFGGNMKIAVCVNHVPDTAAKITIGEDQKSIDQTGLAFVVNPYDEIAIEEALKSKEATEGEVVVLSVGTESNKESIKKALAMGADSAVLLTNDKPRDSYGIAKALADEIKSQEIELVFCGKQSVDYDNSSVGQILAGILGYNCVSVVVEFSLSERTVKCEREIEGGREVVETNLPCVITTQKGLNEPRYASLKGIMAAKKKTVEEKPAYECHNNIEIIEMRKPAPKNPGKIVGTDASAVPELVKLLHEEAKVI
jgi:electron transfer flavoprotein beta subunit